jgi:hypothetical protein
LDSLQHYRVPWIFRNSASKVTNRGSGLWVRRQNKKLFIISVLLIALIRSIQCRTPWLFPFLNHCLFPYYQSSLFHMNLLEPTWLFFWDLLCLEFALNFLLWRHKQSVTDLQQGPARFPVTVTTVYRGVEGKLCTSLFLCNWLVFLTICKPSTAKPPWLHKPPGGYITHLLTLIRAQGFEKLSPESTTVIKIPASCKSGLSDFVSWKKS